MDFNVLITIILLMNYDDEKISEITLFNNNNKKNDHKCNQITNKQEPNKQTPRYNLLKYGDIQDMKQTNRKDARRLTYYNQDYKL